MAERDENDRRILDLNLLGRVVYFAGQSVRITGQLLDAVIELAADAYRDAERAFQQGLDPSIDEAKIIEEHPPEDGPS